MKSSFDKSVQASAQRAIDKDQVFNLEHISQLPDLIRLKITLIVDPNEFQSYSSMTLIQYAISQDKPNSLEYMLGIAKKHTEEINDILRSDNKYGNNNLLFLAVDFKSNKCLKQLIKFFKENDPKFTADLSDPFGESPLARAIKTKNQEAIEILLSDGGADLFYFDQKKNSLSTFMPILSIFFYYKNKEELSKFMEQFIKPTLDNIEQGKFDEMIKKLLDMRFNDNFLKLDDKNNGYELPELLENKGLNTAKEYLLGKTTFHSGNMNIVYDNSSGQTSTVTPDQNNNQQTDNLGNQCFECKTSNGNNRCDICQKFFCDGCFHNHKCNNYS